MLVYLTILNDTKRFLRLSKILMLSWKKKNVEIIFTKRHMCILTEIANLIKIIFFKITDDMHWSLVNIDTITFQGQCCTSDQVYNTLVLSRLHYKYLVTWCLKCICRLRQVSLGCPLLPLQDDSWLSLPEGFQRS